MAEIHSYSKQVANYVADLMPARPKIERTSWRGHAVDLLIASDAPQPGVTTLATVSLSVKNAVIDDVEQQFGVELVTCHYSPIKGALDAVYDAALLNLEHGVELYPGTVLLDVIGRRAISPTMKHFFLVAPYLWEDKLKTFTFDGRESRYLLAVPISDEEMAVAATENSEAFDDLLEKEEADLFDWNRPSVAG